MFAPLLRRIVSIPVVLWATATLTFLILRLVPGDAVDALAANCPTRVSKPLSAPSGA